jgi:FkbM family methyltransferase
MYKKLISPLIGTGISQYFPIKQMHRIAMRFLKAEKVKVGAFTLYLDKLDSLSLTVNTNFEPFVQDALKKIIKPGMRVINIGSHIGFFTTKLSSLVGPTGTVIAFEPDPDTFALLSRNIEVNKLDNVICVPKAVGSSTHNVAMKRNWWNTANTHVVQGDGDFTIGCTSLDEYLGDSNTVDFILIDAEGYETPILQGMVNTIKKNPNLRILTEYGLSDQSFFQEASKYFSFTLLDHGDNSGRMILKRKLKL